MKCEEFLRRWQTGSEFLAGVVNIDIAGHSRLLGPERDIADAKAAFAAFVESQVGGACGGLASWSGDGGFFLFDIQQGCDEMVSFAERLRHLLPYFNGARGSLNSLPFRQELAVRIVCHAGLLRNVDGTPGHVSGSAVNDLVKLERDVGRVGHVVITQEVFNRLRPALQERARLACRHEVLGKTWALDGDSAIALIRTCDRRSSDLKEWIVAGTHLGYDELDYFAYTNELLGDFLAYDLPGVAIRVLARDWLVERKEERRQDAREPLPPRRDGAPHPRHKSQLIRLFAGERIAQAKSQGGTVDVRFYRDPPLFNGAIMTRRDSGMARAFVGLSRWDPLATTGGSPFKLEDWPALLLDARDPVHAGFVQYLRSRFEEMWERGSTFEEVSAQERAEDAHEPETIGRLWALDGREYLIVFPLRGYPNRALPGVAVEDLYAYHLFEEFLARHGVRSSPLTFRLSESFEGNWIPAETMEQIERWDGHLIFVCSKSLAPSVVTPLEAAGFPYAISGIGSGNPILRHHHRKDLALESPMHASPPEPRDYAVIGKWARPEGKGSVYVSAGLRATGTWGAAVHLTDPHCIRLLADHAGDRSFAAVIESEFDEKRLCIAGTKLLFSPECF